MEWSHPAPRMREFILAMRAIWDCWNDGTKLDFQGDFYTHTLMTPFFNPGPNQHGNAKVFLAGVGELMTEVAGEVADGLLVPRLHHRALPARGHAAGPRARAGPFGADAGRLRDLRPGLRRHRRPTRRRWRRRRWPPDARSPSTAPPRPTAACSTCTGGASCSPSSTPCPSGASGRRWASSSTTTCWTPSRWSAEPTQIGRRCIARYGDVVDRISFYAPYQSDPRPGCRCWRASRLGLTALDRTSTSSGRRPVPFPWVGAAPARLESDDDVDQLGRSGDHLARLGPSRCACTLRRGQRQRLGLRLVDARGPPRGGRAPCR